MANINGGPTFESIAGKIGRHKVRTTALMGRHSMPAGQVDTVTGPPGLDGEVLEALQESPMRGSLDRGVPTICRIHQITQF